MVRELEITTMDAKGHVMIPRLFRKRMGIRANSKLVVTQMGNALVMKELDVPDMGAEIDRIFKGIVGCAVTLPKNHPDRPLDVTRAPAGGCSRLGSHRYAFFATANQPQDKLFSHRILNRQAEIRRCH